MPIDAPAAAASGLTADEAKTRLGQFGPNDPAVVRPQSVFADLWRVVANPLVLILVIAAGASAFLGERADAGIITIIVILSASIDFAQTHRSQQAIAHLRDRVAPAATVLRDGAWTEIHRRDVVPGDLVRLSAGDLIPADGRLVTARDLFVQQAALTGESLPAEKEATGATPSTRPDAPNMVFLGTSVVSGIATAEVVATGARTAFGDIAARLVRRLKRPRSIAGSTASVICSLARCSVLCILVMAVSVARHRDPLQSLLFAVALAVGLTPEFLPMITSVTLSRGAVAWPGRRSS